MEILKKMVGKLKKHQTGDQGVDLIASIDNLRICIQCKNHKKVGKKQFRKFLLEIILKVLMQY